jgi:predicted nicotinamide N-methyase
VLDLPQLYTKPSAETLLQTLALLTSAPRSWERSIAESGTDPSNNSARDRQGESQPQHVNPAGVTRYLTSIVSNSLRWIDDDEAKEEIWNQASSRLSERSGRTAMGALSRRFQIPSATGSFELEIHEPTMTGDDLGLKTWAASYLLAKRLHTLNLILPDAQQRLQVLELGAGTGLTDLPSIHSNLARNMESNAVVVADSSGSARTGVLDWTKPTVCELVPDTTDDSKNKMLSHKFPLILAADSLYSPEHPHMLVDTIEVWLSHDSDARVIVEFPYRDAYLPEIQTFRNRMTKLGLHIVEEGEEQGYDDWGSSNANDDQDDDMVVTCWWSIWGWPSK